MVEDGTTAATLTVIRAPRRSGRWVVVGVAAVAVLVLNAVEFGRSGVLASNWGILADVSEIVVPLLAGVLFLVRWRADREGARELRRSAAAESDDHGAPRFDDAVVAAPVIDAARAARDRANGWLWLAAAMLSWAIGQGMWIVIEFGVRADPSVSPASIAFVLTAILTVRGLIKICGLTREWAAVRPVLGDSMILAFSVGFLVWELFLAPNVTDESNLTVLALASLPVASSLVIAVAVVLLIDHRSLVVAAIAVSAAALVVADSALAVHFADGSNVYFGAHLLYLLAFACCCAAALLPHRVGLPPGRRSLVRVFVVIAPVSIAVAVSVVRYMVLGHDANVVSTALIALAGVAWVFAEISRWDEGESIADERDVYIDQVHTSQRRLRELLDDVPEAVVVVSAEGRILDLNGQVLALAGRTHAELIGQSFMLFLHDEGREQVLETWRGLLGHEHVRPPIFPLARPDGRRVVVEADVRSPLTNSERIVITLRDVTNRLREARKLEAAQARFALAFRSAPTGMLLASTTDEVMIDVNDSLATMLGYSRGELIGRRTREIIHPDDRYSVGSDLLDRLDDLRSNDGGRGPALQLEHRCVRSDGQTVWVMTSVGLLDDDDGGHLAIVHIQDVTEQRQTQSHLHWAASHDELTGLPNRTHFLDQLGRRLHGAEAGAVTVLFIDLDNFKVINDSLGHAAGDELLRGMSERLRQVVGDRDLLGRFGGDEFMMMVDRGSISEGIDLLAERVRAALSQPLIVDGAELFVTGSIGMASADRLGVSADELLRDADAAMYRAKSNGRDRVEAFAPGEHETSLVALRTASELRHGLERDEVVPYFQPIVDLVSGQLTGFEVLARWRHPDRGLLTPDQFLPMAEESGLIGELGATILRSALGQLGRWQNNVTSLSDVSISVNVSVRQLVDARFHAIVAEALAESGVRADSLWLEITESALMSDVKTATVALRNLRNLGLHLSVDDFGTGYSSLTYLKRFPVEAIKVDRTFVKGLGIDTEDTTIVEAVVNLGRSLGLMVVAEGVETPLQLSRLRDMGCDRAQGYLFGRPRPAALIEAERASTMF